MVKPAEVRAEETLDFIERKIAKIDKEIFDEIYKDSFNVPLKSAKVMKNGNAREEFKAFRDKKIRSFKTGGIKRTSTVSPIKTPATVKEISARNIVASASLTPVMVKNSVKRINPHRHFIG